MIEVIDFIALILAPFLGIFLKSLTSDEKNIFSNAPYFPIILWALAILAAIFFTIEPQIAKTLTFMFIVTLTWHKV